MKVWGKLHAKMVLLGAKAPVFASPFVSDHATQNSCTMRPLLFCFVLLCFVFFRISSEKAID